VIDWLLQNEASLRLSVFVGLFVLLALAQWWRPRRQTQGQTPRRLTNLALVIIDTLLLRLVLPLLAFDLALQMQRNGVGLLNSLPPLAGVVIGMLALDMMIYWQHRLMHVVPWLWRLHRMHHADTEFDVTTAVRFHPFEIVLSMVIKLGAIAALGVPAVAVLLFEVILNAASLFNHTNLRLSPGVERVLRWFIVTPDMHRIHHSVHVAETNSNFSFSLSIWDRLFGSYCAEPREAPHDTMLVGLHEFRNEKDQSLLALLLNPFRTPPPDVRAAPPDSAG
jgi:sterol desaturase/sphingolipid hydroxylase (fatty acid hydroxylase superfamily)